MPAPNELHQALDVLWDGVTVERTPELSPTSGHATTSDELDDRVRQLMLAAALEDRIRAWIVPVMFSALAQSARFHTDHDREHERPC